MYNNYNPAQARIDSLMQQRQMIDQQIQQVQQYANIPPININNQITPQQQGNFDFNGKWVNNEQEAKNFANAKGNLTSSLIVLSLLSTSSNISNFLIFLVLFFIYFTLFVKISYILPQNKKKGNSFLYFLTIIIY